VSALDRALGGRGRQVLALFGALLHGSLYLVLGATTLLPQALRAGARLASGRRPPLPQARARAVPAALIAAARPDQSGHVGARSSSLATVKHRRSVQEHCKAEFTSRAEMQASAGAAARHPLLTLDTHCHPSRCACCCRAAGMTGAVAASAPAAGARLSCMPASGLRPPLADAQVAAVAAGAVGAAGAVLAGARPSPMAALCLGAWGAAEAAAVAWERARQGAAPGAALLGEVLPQ